MEYGLAFPCGNARPCARLRRALFGFRVKFNLVEIIRQSQNPFQTESDLMRTRLPVRCTQTGRVRCDAYQQSTPRLPASAKKPPAPRQARGNPEQNRSMHSGIRRGMHFEKRRMGGFVWGSAFQTGVARKFNAV